MHSRAQTPHQPEKFFLAFRLEILRFILPIAATVVLLIIMHITSLSASSAYLEPTAILNATATPTSQVTPTISTTIPVSLTGTPSPTFVPITPVISATQTPTATLSLNLITPTVLPEPTFPSDQVYTTTLPQIESVMYFPLVYRNQIPIPPVKALFCSSFSNPRSIPDNSSGGVNDSIVINDNRIITDLDITLDVNHTWVGDLRVQLTHAESMREITLINRPGHPETQTGCGNDNIRTILDDEITSPVENRCASSPAAISGIYQPQVPLGQFDGISVAGTWTLNVSDLYPNDIGTLRNWCLVASISEVPPPPTQEPPPPPSPSQAIINGVTGKAQSLPLDCESRSAVDWAKHFGYSIGEISFFNNLPTSDNPDKGFVGDVYGNWGQIPPNPYGVHAEPVAALLRAFGVPAYAHRPLSWEWLKAEIAEGNPVFVWITGSVDNGIPVYYTPADGLHTIVARYEHTVIVTGYTNSSVYYLNGATIYSKSINQFLDSWSALGNMAITTKP